jgi:N-acetyl sugar amidotransferase
MSNIQFCKSCLYSTTHPLGLTLDEEGICSGCRIHKEKDSLDWDVRWEMLKCLVKPYRNQDAKGYDCIVPVTGAQDSHYIVYLIKERLGLNPLLVTYNKYFNTPLGIRNLANLRIRFNCDILYQNVNPISVKKITRSTLRRFGSIYWPILAGQTVFPVQTAVRYKVPLIIWGAHQGLEQVGMFSHEHEVEMTRRYRKDHDLMGHEADDLMSIFDTLLEKDIWQYRYPDDRDLNAVGVRGIYLGNYVRWDPKAQHEQMMREYDYKTTAFNRTFDCYDHADCFNYMDLHDHLKLYKHGYSKVTDHASREIRFGRLTRKEGLALVRKHEQAPLKYLDQFREWLGVTPAALQFLMDRHRNPKFWEQIDIGKWRFNGWSAQQRGDNSVEAASADCPNIFEANDSLEHGRDAEYITIGKGWP